MERQSGKTSEFLAFELLAYSQNVPPDDESQAAQNNQKRGYRIDQRVCGVVTKTVFRKDIHACIAKGGNGVEYGDPNAFSTEFGNENRHIEKRADSFDQKRAENNVFNESDKARHGIQIKSGLNQLPVSHADPFVHSDHKSRQNGDRSESSDLDQNQNNGLSEGAPCRSGGECCQSRYAGCRRCREKRIDIRHGFSVFCAEGQEKKQASDEDYKQKAEKYNMGCRYCKFFLFYHKIIPY